MVSQIPVHISLTAAAWDSNLIKVNPLFISLNWDAAGIARIGPRADAVGIGGGAFAVIPLSERGKLPDLIPLFKGHSGPVLDTDFNPFNDSVLASGSEDGKVCNSRPTPNKVDLSMVGRELHTLPSSDPDART